MPGNTTKQPNVTVQLNNTLKPELAILAPVINVTQPNLKVNVTVAPRLRRNYTFATLLCDDKLLQATSVLVYSMVNYANTSYPVTIMTLPNVTEAAKEQLRKLGAQIIDITMLEYPFKVTPARLEQNKPCR